MADPLKELTRAIATLRDMDKSKTAANTTALREIGAYLADAVALMEKRPESPDVAALATAFVKAVTPIIKGIPAAQVNVTTPPATVTVQAAEHDKSGQKWRIDVERSGRSSTAPISAFIVTRL